MFDEFYKRSDSLKKLYNINKKVTIEEMDRAIDNIKYKINTEDDDRYAITNENKNKSWIKEIDSAVFGFIFAILFIILDGIFFSSDIGTYFFGVVFFIVGYFVGLKVPKFGIIFLFSHGGTGFGTMFSSVLGDFNYKVLLSDAGIISKIFICIPFMLCIIAFLMVLFYNLSDSLKEKKYLQYLPMILIAISIALIANMQNIINFIG